MKNYLHLTIGILLIGAGYNTYSMEPAEHKKYSVKDLIADNKMPEFDAEDKGLDLQELGLTSLEGLEDFPQAAEIKGLWIDKNPLRTLPAGAFEKFINLEELSLQETMLEKIDPKALQGLSKLKVIFLGRNKLTNLPPELFTFSPKLEEVYLRNSSLQDLPGNIFDWNDSIKTVILKDNKIEELPKKLIERLTQLKAYTDHPSMVANLNEYSVAQLLEDLKNEGKSAADLL